MNEKQKEFAFAVFILTYLSLLAVFPIMNNFTACSFIGRALFLIGAIPIGIAAARGNMRQLVIFSMILLACFAAFTFLPSFNETSRIAVFMLPLSILFIAMSGKDIDGRVVLVVFIIGLLIFGYRSMTTLRFGNSMLNDTAKNDLFFQSERGCNIFSFSEFFVKGTGK